MAYKCPLYKKRILNNDTEVFILTNQRRLHEPCLAPLLRKFESKNKPVKDLRDEYKEISSQGDKLEIKKFDLEYRIEKLQQELIKATSVVHKITSFFTGNEFRQEHAIKEELFRQTTTYRDIVNEIELNNNMEQETLKKLGDAISKRKPIYEILKPIFDYWPSYPPDWDERREQLSKKCKVVGEGHHGALHVHHIKPLSLGGTNKISNLRVLCERHHLKEHKIPKFRFPKF